MMRFLPAIVCALAVFCPTAATAAESGNPISDDSRVQDAVVAWVVWVEAQAARDGVPGVSAAVVHQQETLFAGGFGLADPETGRAADAETLYSICSISKLFTAIGVMQQRDAGALDLDEPLATYLPWFADLEDVHGDDEAITLRRILTHSAGLPRESDAPYWAPDFDFPTREEVRRILAGQQTLYPSGRYHQYSNLGLTLAGEAVAAVTDSTWEDYTHERILEPLAMADTFTSVAAAHSTGRLAAGYSERRGGPDRERLGLFEVEGIAPAAGMASSANDLALFAKWQLGLYQNGGEEVLRAATLREMQRVHWMDPDWETTWGLGFSVFKLGKRTVAGHGGGCPGFYTSLRVVPSDQFAVAVLANAIGADVSHWAAMAIKAIAPAVEAAGSDDEDPATRDPAFDRYVGTYDTVWGRFAIVRWKDGLAVVDLDMRDPFERLPRLEHVEGHTFRRVRHDDKSLGETWVFEVDGDGAVLSVTSHSNPATRVR